MSNEPSSRVLHVTSPLMKGFDVLDLQQLLTTLKYYNGVMDFYYGPDTEKAVERFQEANQLTVDGVVGPMTRLKLDMMSMTVSPETMTSGRKALSCGLRSIGVTENPAGSNQTAFGRWYGIDGVPWCNIFVSYCFVVGANLILCDGYKGPGVRAGRGCAYVPTTEAWLKEKGFWVAKTERPLPGDIVIYNWDSQGAEHIGIVKSYLGGDRFMAVEGNTSVSNDSNGGEVMLRTRSVEHVEGYGRIL